ncbi:MAG: phosphorylase [Pseudomonadota bacterium]|nr:MAG: phosphorylase [Pseudomonadota bacterium]
MNPENLLLTPGSLWPALKARSRSALACGALRPIETDTQFAEERGMRFVVRMISSLALKDQARRQQAQAPNRTGKPVNPFLPYEPELFVADITRTHLVLLNKFNVIDHHLLIITRDFEHQETLLTLADFEALWACMAEFDALGFYNGGVVAGASQPHKHLQMVPLPLDGAPGGLPLEPLLPAQTHAGEIATVPALPFVNAFARLDPALLAQPREMAARCHDLYMGMLDTVGVGTTQTSGESRQSTPYNLLIARQWMLLVPRSTEFCEGISINALGYAGSLFVRNSDQMQGVHRVGPMYLLTQVSVSRD